MSHNTRAKLDFKDENVARARAQKSRPKKKWTVCDSGKWDFDRSRDTKLPLKNEQWPAAVDRKVERVDQSEWKKDKDLRIILSQDIKRPQR